MKEPTLTEIKENRLWRSMGLSDEEYQKICETLQREPNYTELGMYAVLWSEHCAYKHTRPFFKLFPTSGERILQGPGENAGIVDIGDGWAVVFKVESHNHPSAIEPYEGAATGVGGILRDIFTMGARPIACLNSLRFGELANDRVKHLVKGVVSGIAGYGNAVGVPTVGGEVYFDQGYAGNPLVNVMAVGLVRHEQITKAVASGVGNPVMVVGSYTGRDGIHGATFASEELTEESEERRPAVQVGDPFTEKLLIEACLELISSGVVVGIQDMGAAGLTSSACEMASRSGSGIEMDISLVPRREAGMTPYEVMLSESQERMLVVPKDGSEEQVKAIFAKYGLPAVVVGRVTDDGMIRIYDGEKLVAEVPAKSLSTDGAPVYLREGKRPAYLDEAHSFDPEILPLKSDYTADLLKLLESPTIASKEWIYRQYDHMVQLNTVVPPGPADAAVLRVKGTTKGIAVTIDGNGRQVYLDPYQGAMAVVAEAARNLICCGAEPIGLTDGLNFGNPERPEVYWQLEQAIKGLADAARFLGIPVTGGNASLYNESSGEAIYPTPIVGMVGLLEDISTRLTSSFKEVGDVIALLGWPGSELGGSEYLKLVNPIPVGKPPRVDLAREKALQKVMLEAAGERLLKSAHDISEGGLAVCVAESCLQGGLGAEIELPWEGRPDALLFAESGARIVVSLKGENWARLQQIASESGVPLTRLGQVQGSEIQFRHTGVEHPLITVSVRQAKDVWKMALEKALLAERG
ncbi:MAG: phosphoribosylformylglycinamidine synthase subunit PurL [Firmicutes bacterium]|nr:phosphoribosylformylglycinamidine synthase subunit PurL [Bacillota bacterium]